MRCPISINEAIFTMQSYYYFAMQITVFKYLEIDFLLLGNYTYYPLDNSFMDLRNI